MKFFAEFLNFSSPVLPQFGFCFINCICTSMLNSFFVFHSTLCIFIDLFNGFIHTLLEIFENIHNIV